MKTSCPYDRKKFKAIKVLKRQRRKSHKEKVFGNIKKVGSISMDAHKRKLVRDKWHCKSAKSLRLSYEATQLGYEWMKKSIGLREFEEYNVKNADLVQDIKEGKKRMVKLRKKLKEASLLAEKYMKQSRACQRRSDELMKLIRFSLHMDRA